MLLSETLGLGFNSGEVHSLGLQLKNESSAYYTEDELVFYWVCYWAPL